MNRVLLALVAGALVWIVSTQVWPRRDGLPPMPPASPTNDGKPSATSVKRIEIVDDLGKVMIVLTSENGVPIAVVNDRGEARKIDLAKVARMAR